MKLREFTPGNQNQAKCHFYFYKGYIWVQWGSFFLLLRIIALIEREKGVSKYICYKITAMLGGQQISHQIYI